MNRQLRINRCTLVASAVVAAAGVASPATAGVVFDVVEGPTNVVMYGSGTFDLTGWTDGFNAIPQTSVSHDSGFVGEQADDLDEVRGLDLAPNMIVPGNLGPPSETVFADYGTGDVFGLTTYFDDHVLFVPAGYESGDPLFGTAVFENNTIAEMGLAPGEYTWTWSTPTAGSDFFTLRIAPEPASLGLCTAAGLVLLLRRKTGV